MYQFGGSGRNLAMPAPLKFDWPNFWRSLGAVLLGNAIYYAVWRFLPVRGQHHLYQIDWGLAVDFWICLACYGVLRMIH